MSSKNKQSTKGWNWGNYELKQDEFEFQINGQHAFSVPYAQIGLSSASGNNEVTFEFQDANADQKKKPDAQMDMLCEMRFHVPNNELELYEEERIQTKEAAKKAKKKQGAEENKEENKAQEDEESDDEEMTAAKLFNNKVVAAAGIGQFAGEIICSIQDLPMIIPRGKISLDFYAGFAKLHGKTHDYKINYKDIQKIFLLQKPDGVHMVYLIQLDVPLRTGVTLHHFIAMNFEYDQEESVKLNLTPEELSQKYKGELKPTVEGKLYDVLSTLFNNLAGITKIIVPADFRSARGTKAVKCSVTANEGLLYPLKSSLIFIHKPVHYIRHAEIKFVEFSRIAQGGQAASRSFDLTITKLKDNKVVSFASIETEEQRLLTDYFKAAGIKMRVLDADTRNIRDFEDEGSESENSAANEGGKRRQAAKANQQVGDAEMEDEYDSEEDEDFKESGSEPLSGSDSDGSGEDDGSSGQKKDEGSDSGSAIDSGIDKEEMAEMKKELARQGDLGKRKRRPVKE